MLRWFPMLLLPIVGFLITQNCQRSASTISEAPKKEEVVESAANVPVPPTMRMVVKRSSARQAARADKMPRKVKKPIRMVRMVDESEEQEAALQDPRVMRRNAKDALSDELARHPEPTRGQENSAYQDDKKWIDSLSGLSLQNNKTKHVKPECDQQRCPLDKPYVDVFGVVFETEQPDLQGRLEQGSYVEKTPAFYIK